MGECAKCGKTEGWGFDCNRCGLHYCSDHRLPENHDCHSAQARTGRSSVASVAPSGESHSNDVTGIWLVIGFLLLPVYVVVKVVTLTLRLVFTPYGFVAIVLFSAFLVGVSATAGTGIEPLDDIVDDVVPSIEVGGPPANETNSAATPTESPSTEAPSQSTPDPGSGPSGGSMINESAVEIAIHREINEERREQNLEPLSYDGQLASIADGHSEDMAERNYFSHESPEGETMGDRYDEAGYRCRRSTGGNSYATGGENIAFTSATGGSPPVIGEGIVNQWMNSEGHRENLLRPYWRNEGIGIAVRESGDGAGIYATQNFC